MNKWVGIALVVIALVALVWWRVDVAQENREQAIEQCMGDDNSVFASVYCREKHG